MTFTDHAIGVTPIIIRRAFYYLSLGLGEYRPDHPHYDLVRVDPLYEPAINSDNPTEWSMGITVSFYKDNRRIRWVEFGCRLTGAGGDPILRKVENTNEEISSDT